MLYPLPADQSAARANEKSLAVIPKLHKSDIFGDQTVVIVSPSSSLILL
jgi:hypothetical protein